MIQPLICREHPGLEHFPTELVQFARRQIVNAALHKGDELRSEGRYPMLVPLRAIEVDQDNNPRGEEMELVTRDISATGIGMIYTEKIEAKRMAIQFLMAGTEVNLVVDVVWSGALGPFYGAGGKYIEKLDEFVV